MSVVEPTLRELVAGHHREAVWDHHILGCSCGWMHSKPHEQHVDDMLAEARTLIALTKPPPWERLSS